MSKMQSQVLNVQKIRGDFPILLQKIHGKQLVYLDNGATSLTPKVVVDAMDQYYHEFNANVHRGVHTLSEKATFMYESSRKKIADFLHADPEEIIFTRGTTESLNLLAYSLTQMLAPGDEIIISEMEHHSNIVPWQQLAKQYHLVVKFIKVTSDGVLDMNSFGELLSEKTKIVSVMHVSNVLGTINDVKRIASLAHQVGAVCIVDGAQSVPHLPIDVKMLDCDFFACSGHKMLGPTGVGVLYGKRSWLEMLPPFMFGGDMIAEVHFDSS